MTLSRKQNANSMIPSTTNSDNTNKQIVFLDGLRGLAALYVMIGHARWLLWEGYSEGYLKHPELYGAFQKAVMYFFSLFKYGHEAVLFFFVLSGFVIHLKHARQIKKGVYTVFDFKTYLGRRAKRLYPPLLFALLLTFMLDSYGRTMNYGIYTGFTNYSVINESINSDLGLKTFLGNLLFLQRTFVPVYGSNGPLWSLMYEWWFYMIYPLFLIINKRSIAGSFGVVTIVATLASLLPEIPMISTVLQYFFSWCLGAFLADFHAKRYTINAILPVGLTLLLPAMFILDSKVPFDVLADTLWAIGFAALIYTLLRAFQNGKNFRILSKLKWLGDCSYTLYIIHFPIFVLFSGALMHFNRGLLPVSQWYIVLGVSLALVLAYLMHFIIEKPFTKTKRKVEHPVVPTN